MSDRTRDTDGQLNVAREPGAIDALVPAPWSTARRLMVMLGVLILLTAMVLAIRSGLVGPRVEHHPSWGSSVQMEPDGSLVAERLAPIRNAGMLPVELQALELPALPGVRWGEVSGVPGSLGPGEQVEVTIRFEVMACTVDAGGLDTFPIRARSGIAPARVVAVPAPQSIEPEPGAHTSGPADATIAAVLAAWADQPPSWVLDTIAAACLDPDLVGSSTTGGTGP